MAHEILKYQLKHEFTLHPAARRPFEVMQTLSGLCNDYVIPEKIRMAWAFQTIHCVPEMHCKPKGTQAKHRPRKFFFYSPVWAPKYWVDGHPPKDTLIVYEAEFKKQLSPKQVENQAWLSLFQLLSLSLHSKNAVAFIDAWRQGVPEHFSREYFGKDSLPDQYFCDLLSMSRGALVQQRQRLSSSGTTPEAIDWIAEMATHWEPEK
ncbi:hypothetical protein [Shewanella zhangzhouensis]|uniref:hypothetical protein n=1 Tax=Shewanella zhangzhouensis TaxID=2864213 RepID=UPI001C657BCC|nr:hypothetical protein [Shewanella zhangzhouensis]QYK03541.1 hypothetical protein K0H63_10485 [Shewanella zhangzhouensis]